MPLCFQRRTDPPILTSLGLLFLFCYIEPPSWYFDPPYPCYIKPRIHGIANPLPMVYWTPYPWYIEPSTHGILTPLSMVYRTPYPWYIELPLMVLWTPYPWYIEHRIHGISNPMVYQTPTYGVKYDMAFWTRCQNTIWYIEPGVDFSGVQNTIWQRV